MSSEWHRAADVAPVLGDLRRQQMRSLLRRAAAAALVLCAFWYAGALDLHRYADALPTLLTLIHDALPPDFRRLRGWGKPLLETVAMGLVGTVLSALAAVPLGLCAARNVVAHPLIGAPARMLLNVLRSIPELIWGVMFVAAVGFGPLPGALALAAHSTGMLGKFFAETLEHVEPGPSDALRSHGVSHMGVLRFSVLPQALPRLVDVTLYRLEHNMRAATTMGMVGAGGLGLEIVTAFQLFEYREACALIAVLLLLVTLISGLSALIRSHFLTK